MSTEDCGHDVRRGRWEPYESDWHDLGWREWDELTDDEKIRRVKAAFHFAAMGEIWRSLPHIKIGSAIMSFCALDFLGSLNSTAGKNCKRYKKFCREYLQQIDDRYDDSKLYQARCKLVHNYSREGHGRAGDGVKDIYYITWDQGGDIHLKPSRVDGVPMLVIERFAEDVGDAGDLLFDDKSKRHLILQQVNAWHPIGFRMAGT